MKYTKKIKRTHGEKSPLPPCKHHVCFAASSPCVLGLSVHSLALKNSVHISWLSESVSAACFWYLTCNLRVPRPLAT